MNKQLHFLFRIACAMCFIGHGTFGFITKKIWCNYFAVFGIGPDLAYMLMPVVGAADVVFGMVLIIYPMRISAVWLVFWGLFTALLRPLSGEPFAEFIERAGNYGAPVILLLLSALPRRSGNPWFEKLVAEDNPDNERAGYVLRSLQCFGFLLMAGHAWLNLIGKQGLLDQYARLGFTNPAEIAQIVGAFEGCAALLILVQPARWLILILVAWKMISETFYLDYPVLEWIERGGSYAVLLGLWHTLKDNANRKRTIYHSLLSARNKINLFYGLKSRHDMKVTCLVCVCCLLFMQCGSGLSNDTVRKLLTENRVYPLTVEHKIFCNDDDAVLKVQTTGLVKDGLVTAQVKHTLADIGKPLITFTPKSQPYLLTTSDTLQSFDIQKVKIGDELFQKVLNIEVSRSGKQAVVDYTTTVENLTPFVVLYVQDVSGEHKRRTFFTWQDDGWRWDGKIVKMD